MPEANPSFEIAVKEEKTGTKLSDTQKLILTSGISGAIADTLVQPVFHVKTLQMTAVDGAYLSGWETAKQIVKAEGPLALYRGLTPVLCGLPGTALFFYGVDTTKKILGDSPSAALLAGFAGQLTGSICWLPTSVITESWQVAKKDPAKSRGLTLSSLTLSIVRKEGIRGLYKALVPQLITYGPPNSLGFAGAAKLRQTFTQDNPTLVYQFASNGLSFFGAGVVSAPADVVRTRLQIASIDKTNYPERTILACVQRIWCDGAQQHGFWGGPRALFAGGLTRGFWFGARQGTAVTGVGVLTEWLNGPAAPKNN